MGRPTEYNGVNCSECRASCRGLKDWNNLTQTYINDGYRIGWYHVFFRGEYYRRDGVSGYYLCRECFYRPRRQAEERQRQEEEERRRAQEAERRQREEEERRRRQQEEERRQEEQRKLNQREYDARRKVEAHKWIQSKNEDFYENRITEHQQRTRRQVFAGTYGTFTEAEDSISQTLVPNSFLEPFDDFLVKIRSYFKIDPGANVNDLENILAVLHSKLFYEWPEERDERLNVEWLKTLQTFLLEIYLWHCVYKEDIAGNVLDATSDELNSILVNLCSVMRNRNEQLNFTKVLFVSALTSEIKDSSIEKKVTCVNACTPSIVSKFWTKSSDMLSRDVGVIAKKHAIDFLQKLLENSELVVDKDDASDRWQKACFECLIKNLSSYSDKKIFSSQATKFLCLTKNNVWDPLQSLRLLKWVANHSKSKTAFKVTKIEEILSLILNHRISSQHLCESSKLSLIDYIELHDTNEVIEHIKKIVDADELKSVVDIIAEMEEMGAIDSIVGKKVKTIVESAQKINVQTTFKDSESETMHVQKLISTLRQLEALSEETLPTVLAVLCSAVYSEFKYVPRATQMVSWTLLALLEKGCLQEISTGEGKSCIVAMFAVYLHLKDKFVDIVTSSPVLAQRDAEEWKKFYELFGITVDYNINKINEKESRKCYSCNIVYGTVEAFAADILKQEFEQKDIRPGRRFDAVVVDEVDFMLLDEGVQYTFLTHQATFLRHVETALAMVWAMVNKFNGFVTESGKTFTGSEPQAFHKIVFDLIDCLKVDGVCNIESSIDILEIAEHENLIETGFSEEMSKADNTINLLQTLSQVKMLKILDILGDYLPCTFTAYTMTQVGSLHKVTKGMLPILVLDKGFCCSLTSADNIPIEIGKEIKNHIQFGEKSNADDPKLGLPRCFRKYVDERMDSWVKNAFVAKQYQLGRDYVIERVDEEEEVLPVAFRSTGVIEYNKRWGDGLHQFLQLKHGLIVKSISMVTNFMSNLAFFQRYKGNIFGVSGTLGSENEQAFLNRHCSVQHLIPIPTARPKKFFEVDGIIAENKTEWIDAICNVIKSELVPKSNLAKGRAALIICEDIISAVAIGEALKQIKPNPPSVHMYTRSNEAEKQMLNSTLNSNQVIVATNLAGRGSDIKVSTEVVASGGLFVLLSFLPQNNRVEKQGFGRSARKGLPGSGQIVINLQNIGSNLLRTAQNTTHMKEIRDHLCCAQLALLEEEEIQEVKLKEKLFDKYCKFLTSARGQIFDLTDDRTERELMIGAMHEAWAVWLQNVSEKINDKSVGNEDALFADLQTMCEQSKSKLMSRESPTGNIYHIIKFGNEMICDGHFDKASNFFTQCINLDWEWASFAYYNRAYCKVIESKKSEDLQGAIDDLERANSSLQSYQKSLKAMVSLLSTSSEANFKSGNLTRQQLNVRGQIYGAYENNMKKAIEKLKTLKNDGDNADADAMDLFSIVDEADNLTKNELCELWELGLRQLYSIKKKPRFCWDALWAMLIGVLEVIAGAVICAFSFGSAASIGMNLMSEGVSDVISGIKGMISGAFDFAQWAIDKAISIAMALVTWGASKIFKDGLKAGLKSIKDTAKNALKELKEIPRRAFKELSEEGIKNVARNSFKNIGKHIGKEIAKQGLMELVNYAEDELFDNLKNAVKGIVKQIINKKIQASIRTGELKIQLDTILLSEEIQKCSNDEAKIKIIIPIASDTFESFSSDPEWQSKLSESLNSVLQELKKENKAYVNYIKAIEAAVFSVNMITCANRINEIMDEYDSRLSQALKKFYQDMCYKAPENLNNVGVTDSIENLKQKIGNEIGDIISQAITDKMNQKITKVITRKINSKVENFVENRMLKMEDTQKLIIEAAESRGKAKILRRSDATVGLTGDNAEAHDKTLRRSDATVGLTGDNAEAHDKMLRRSDATVGLTGDNAEAYDKVLRRSDATVKPTSGKADMLSSVIDEQIKAWSQISKSLLEARVLSKILHIPVKIVQEEPNGKLTTITYITPPTNAPDSEAVTIICKQMEGIEHDVHYNACVGGKIVEIKSENKNSIFQAVAQARHPHASEDEIKRQVADYRNMVSSSFSEEPAKWGECIQRKEQTEKLRKVYSLGPGVRENSQNRILRLKKSNFSVSAKMNEELIDAFGKNIAYESGSCTEAKGSSLLRALIAGLTETKQPTIRVFTEDYKQFLLTFHPTSSNVIRGMISHQIDMNNLLEALKLACISATSAFDKQACEPKKLSGKFKQRVMAKEVSDFKAVANVWYNKLQQSDPSLFNSTQLDQFCTWIDEVQFNNPHDETVKLVIDAIKAEGRGAQDR